MSGRQSTVMSWVPRIGSVLLMIGGYFLVRSYDIPLMRFRYGFATEDLLSALDQVIIGFRDFAQIMTLVVVVAVVAAYDRRRRHVITAVLLAQAIAWIAYQVPKRTVPRYRPWAAIEHVAALDQLALGATWIAGPVDIDGDPIRSFPSGHSAAAFALAAVLAACYSRLRWLFWLLAFGCAFTRYLNAVHWPSDCWPGAAIGYSVGWLVLRFVPTAPIPGRMR
jgi:membrane-associated phospholipid phosphatase